MEKKNAMHVISLAPYETDEYKKERDEYFGMMRCNYCHQDQQEVKKGNFSEEKECVCAKDTRRFKTIYLRQ